MAADAEQTYRNFKQAVNMTPATLTKWLKTPESEAVGWKEPDGKGEGESVGHAEGRRIVELLHKGKSALTDDDHAHMARVVGYVHRHLAEGGPAQDKEHSRWRYSLMNWGHDPCQ